MSRLIDADALIEFCAERWIPLNIDAVNMQPTIQPEKAQLSSEDATKDAISKTETVEHLRRVLEATVPNTDYDEGYIDGIEFGISTVSTMPTVQPVATDEQVAEYCKRRCLHVVTHDFFRLAQPEPQWIPVSERLPEDLSEVNVTWVNHNPELYYESAKDKPFAATAVYYNGEWYWYSAICVDYLEEYGRCDRNKVDDVIEIVAWMPLPEPYKPNK